MERANLIARFDCAEYFDDFAAGRFDEAAIYWYVLPCDAIEVLGDGPGREALIVGRAGVDGITFCYREGQPGIWAHAPIEGEWRLMAASLTAFWSGWSSGHIVI